VILGLAVNPFALYANLILAIFSAVGQLSTMMPQLLSVVIAIVFITL
jgi:hypothetical protein